MQFDEPNSIKIEQYKLIFIYFLLDNNEVVYVGQTTQGLSRPFSHHRDKTFNEIRLIYCKADQLDELENKYILKYNPKYNKIINCTNIVSVSKLRSTVRSLFFKHDCFNAITKKRLNTIFHKLNITPFGFNDRLYIQKYEFDKVIEFVDANRELSWEKV